MGLRGPKPGRRVAAAAVVDLADAEGLGDSEGGEADDAQPPQEPHESEDRQPEAQPEPEVPYWHRENPEKAVGDDLIRLARMRGIAQSTIDRMDEARLRREIANAEQMMREDGEL